MTETVLIVGIGNELLGDEGVGVHVARSLAACDGGLPDHVHVTEAGTSLFDVVIEMSRYSKVYIVDAMLAGQVPGSLYRLDGATELAELSTRAAPLSLHEWGVADTLRAATALGLQPHCLTLIGVEPANVAPGTELSPEVKRAAVRIVSLLLEELGVATAPAATPTAGS